jgi:putative ABC transport system substrate-binding protein
MRRRQFIKVLGSAITWPLTARAQEQMMPVVGYVSTLSAATNPGNIDAFRQGLLEAGYAEGSDVAVEYRWAEGRYDRLPALIAEFVSRPVAVIYAATLPAALAAKAATSIIPLVFVVGADPTRFGLVASLSRPGGNATGITQFFGALGGKRLELLRGLVPAASTIAVLSNPDNQNAEIHLAEIEAAARPAGLTLHVLKASAENEVETAFASLSHARAGALLVADDPFFTSARSQLVTLAARHAVPTMYYNRDFPAAGGLISYGSNTRDNHHQGGIYVGRILKGARPADLPVLQPTKFELVINLKTARALGLSVPSTIVVQTDEVIE